MLRPARSLQSRCYLNPGHANSPAMGIRRVAASRSPRTTSCAGCQPGLGLRLPMPSLGPHQLDVTGAAVMVAGEVEPVADPLLVSVGEAAVGELGELGAVQLEVRLERVAGDAVHPQVVIDLRAAGVQQIADDRTRPNTAERTRRVDGRTELGDALPRIPTSK